jgi:hypothetical protein
MQVPGAATHMPPTQFEETHSLEVVQSSCASFWALHFLVLGSHQESSQWSFVGAQGSPTSGVVSHFMVPGSHLKRKFPHGSFWLDAEGVQSAPGASTGLQVPCVPAVVSAPEQ